VVATVSAREAGEAGAAEEAGLIVGRMRSRMRTWIAVLTLLPVSLLLVAGCGGGEEGEAPPETSSESTEETTLSTTVSAAESATAQRPTVTIANSEGERVEVEVEIADTRTEQAQGLMERTELAENAGMLFILKSEQSPGFFMENTLIPLSIAFIDSEGRIVDIQDMQPLDETHHYPAEPAQYMLEVNQGLFAERGVQVGDQVELPRSDPAEPPDSTVVVQAFRDAGLEVGESYPVEQGPGWDELPVPRTYEEATRFLIPSLGADAGGRVFVFGSETDLRAVRDFYEGLASSTRPSVYDEGLVLLQLSNQLPEDEAERYSAVLREVV
jgi:uncharacterized protein